MLSKKRICLIGPVPPYKGGISHYNDSLVKQLELKNEVIVYSFKRQYPKVLMRREQKDKNSKKNKQNYKYDIDSLNPATWAKTANKIININPDIVIMPWWISFWFPMYLFFFTRLKLNKIKILLICHNVYEHENNFLKKLISAITISLSDHILVHSASERSKIRIKQQTKTLVHLHPIYKFKGIGTPTQKTSEDNKLLKVLFFGFVRKYKGLDLLLKALSILKDDAIHVTIAGEFWDDKDEYLRLAELSKPSTIKIIDRYIPNEEVKQLFDECDVVVLPYRSATGSGVLATAYGYKKPVLATDVGGLPEAVVNRKTGFITKPNPIDLANGLLWFKEHKNLDYPKEIEKLTETKMSWESLSKTIEKLL